MTVSLEPITPAGNIMRPLGRNPLHEDIVQPAVRLHPASVGPHLLPGASIGDISPIGYGTPLILEWTR